MIQRDRATWWAAAIVLGYLILAVLYSVVNPLFESPDEFQHYKFVRYLIDQRALPVQSAAALTEYQQPPLYYALGALAAGSITVEPFEPLANPFWGYDQYRAGVDNKVQFIHTARENYPWQGTALAVHLLRLYSVALGALALIAGWQALCLVFGRGGVAIGALAIMAWNPQLAFISSSINNDTLVALIGALAIWWSVRVLRDGVNVRRAVAGGLLLGAALLTKVSAGALALPMLIALLYAPASRAARLKTAISGGAIVVALAGWWYIRNLQLYGELTGVNTMLQAWGTRPLGEGLNSLGVQLRFIWTSYWGRFGIGQIGLPEWGYTLITLISLVSFIGLIKQIIGLRHSTERGPSADRRGLGLLIVVLLSSLAVVIYFALVNPTGANGRYLFPASTALAGLLAYGLRGWYRPWDEKIDRAFAWVLSIAMLLFNIGALCFILSPAYSMPDRLELPDVRASTRPLDLRFDDAVVLLGAALNPQHAASGAEVTVRLCWQTLSPTSAPLAFFIHVLGENNAIVGNRTSLHGLSRYPSVNWQPDQIFCDDVPVRVSAAAATGVYDVEVGLMDINSRRRLEAHTPAGEVIAPLLIDRLKVRSDVAPALPAALQAPIDFGGQIRLLARTVEPRVVTAGDPLTATLYWQAARVPDKDYTVFVQMLDARGRQVANADSMPQTNRYPTSFWDANEIVSDAHRIDLPPDLPPGEYRIIVGWYDLATGARLPRDGDPRGDVQIANVGVSAR